MKLLISFQTSTVEPLKFWEWISIFIPQLVIPHQKAPLGWNRHGHQQYAMTHLHQLPTCNIDRNYPTSHPHPLQWRHNERGGVWNDQRIDFCSTVGSGADQRKHQSSASLAFVRVIHRWPVVSPHKGSVTRKMFPFDDVIMIVAVQMRSCSTHHSGEGVYFQKWWVHSIRNNIGLKTLYMNMAG